MNKKFNIVWLLPIIFIIFLFSIWPVIISISDAFISSEGKLTLENFSKVFSDKLFTRSLVNSLVFGLTTFISIGLSLYLMVAIISLMNRWIRGSFISLIFIQYVFLGIAISSGYIYFFGTDNGVLNIILGMFGVDNINFINDPRYSMITLCTINIFTSLPFLVSTFTFRALSYISKKEDLIKTNQVSMNDWILIKAIMLNMARYILFISYFTLIQNILTYPTALFSDDLSAVFVAHSQTLVCYINRCITLGNYSNAAVCSIVTLILVSLITLVFGLIYTKFIRGKIC